MRMLLVEDDAMTREFCTLLLESEGHAVEVAESGEQALELLRTAGRQEMEAPDVVLADIQMPGIAGAELALALRGACRRGAEEGEQDRTLLLAMSASEPLRATLNGYDGFVLKPFTMEALGLAIARAGLRGDGNAGSESGDEVEVPELDEAVFARLVATMPVDRLRELYALGLGDTRVRIERMRAAAGARDEEMFRRTAHQIKGACGMIGASELRAMAGGLERTGLGDGTLEVTQCLNRFAMACERLEGMLRRRWTAS
ncbi:MAG TPA: response regulator [Granulicella sp.]|jgi:CheY-like chemotaxis protein|nr:response regulator [Granulicella sp.]